MSVIHVQQYQIDQYWPHVEKYMDDALKHSHGEMNASQLRFSVSKGMCELFVAIDNDKVTGAAAVEFINYPNFRSANVIAIGGRGVIRHWEEFKEWLRLGGASYVEGNCRESIARLWKSKLGMSEHSIMMRGSL